MRLSNVWYQHAARVAVDHGSASSVALLHREWKGMRVESTDDLWEILMTPETREAFAQQRDTEVVPWDQVVFRPAVLAPPKILCIGLNYRRHAEETGAPIPMEPVVFSKFTAALAAHEETIKIPPQAHQMDYEAELVLVMGRHAWQISRNKALDYVAGYTVGNDISARDLQLKTSQWLLGKASPGFGPIGPSLVTTEEIADPNGLSIRLWRNQDLCQNSSTADMIFSCREIIAYLSSIWPLEPGDVIFTGTPEGVILGQTPETRHWLSPGEIVRAEIEGLGQLTNYFSA